MKLSQPSKYVKLLLDDLVLDICRVTKDMETRVFLRGCSISEYHHNLEDAMRKWDAVKQEILDILNTVQ